MLNSKFSRVGLSYAFAALLVVAAPGVGSTFAAASSTSSTRLLSSKLPQGLTLRKASLDQTAEALKAAATDRPDLAVALLQAAVSSHSKDGKFEGDCEALLKFVQSAADGAPKKLRELSEAADALAPECASTLDKYLTDANLPGLDSDPNSVTGDVGAGGFGAGFGPGFPGSPGFIGSAPGGTLALPPLDVPIGNPTTTVTNG